MIKSSRIISGILHNAELFSVLSFFLMAYLAMHENMQQRTVVFGVSRHLIPRLLEFYISPINSSCSK
jgi:hypothetical protein